MKAIAFKQDFSGGIVDTSVKYRPNVPECETGLEVCENFLITPSGTLQSRPAAEYWGTGMENLPIDNCIIIDGYLIGTFDNATGVNFISVARTADTTLSWVQLTAPFVVTEKITAAVSVGGIIYLALTGKPLLKIAINKSNLGASTVSAVTIVVTPETDATKTAAYQMAQLNKSEATYPKGLLIYKNRLWITIKDSPWIFASRLGTSPEKYEDFTLGGLATDAFAAAIPGQWGEVIRWMTPLKGLLIGTSEAEWLLDTEGDVNNPLTTALVRQTCFGSTNDIVVNTGNDVLFFGDGYVRGLKYSQEAGGNYAENLNQRARTVLGDAIYDTCAVIKYPYTIVWLNMYTHLVGITKLESGKVAISTVRIEGKVIKGIASTDEKLYLIITGDYSPTVNTIARMDFKNPAEIMDCWTYDVVTEQDHALKTFTSRTTGIWNGVAGIDMSTRCESISGAFVESNTATKTIGQEWAPIQYGTAKAQGYCPPTVATGRKIKAVAIFTPAYGVDGNGATTFGRRRRITKVSLAFSNRGLKIGAKGKALLPVTPLAWGDNWNTGRTGKEEVKELFLTTSEGDDQVEIRYESPYRAEIYSMRIELDVGDA